MTWVIPYRTRHLWQSFPNMSEEDADRMLVTVQGLPGISVARRVCIRCGTIGMPHACLHPRDFALEVA